MIRVIAGSLAAAILGSGCVPVQQNSQATPQRQVTYGGSAQPQPQPANQNSAQVAQDLGPAGPRIFDDFSRATDPCAAQMQDVCEALLLYYAAHRELPASLQQLARYAADAHMPMALNCPVSTQQYVYNPNGPLLSNSLYLMDNTGHSVSVANQMALGHMVLYDASPAHQGERWAIVFGKDTRGSAPVASPFRIPEKAFQDALRASPMH